MLWGDLILHWILGLVLYFATISFCEATECTGSEAYDLVSTFGVSGKVPTQPVLPDVETRNKPKGGQQSRKG